MDLLLLSLANKVFRFPIFSILPSLLRFLLISSLLSSSFVFASNNNSKALSTQKQCIEDHFSALLHLKQAFSFSDDYSNTRLSSWNPDNRDCCSWEGITCDGANGHVIGLNLGGLYIQGSFNYGSLFRLRSLRRLNLAENGFDDSPFPSGFEQLTSLTHLNLSWLSFYGQIPLEISRLTNLVSLDLSSIYYIDTSTFSRQYLNLENPNIGALAQNLSSLRELHLDMVHISGSDWSQALSSALPQLRKLSLSGCGLSGPIHSSFSKLQFLSELDLSDNHLHSMVPNFIGNFSSLTSLRISNCELYGKFPNSIFILPILQTLIASSNPSLTGYFPGFLRSNYLQQLDLSGIRFSGKLPESLGNLKLLTMINLGYCNLTGPLPSSLANLDNLVSLDLSFNGFSGPIPSSYGNKLRKLEELNLSNNSLSGTIPSSLFSLPSLRDLDLRNNQLGGQLGEFHNASSLPLGKIYLDKNKLQGPIPMSIFQLTGLTLLSLSSNNFSGNVELGLFQTLKNFSVLDLSDNNLSVNGDGSNSTSLSFPQIDSLKLRSCNITKFPGILRNQESMYYLDLSNNSINGELPNWIWKVGYSMKKGYNILSYVNLSHNALTGLEQPILDSHLGLMDAIDLSFNMLEGSILIPPRFISFFSLSSNNLSGEVPSLICNFTSIQVLDLSNNHFSGSIPPCLGEISDSLIVLNLGGNAFYGPLLQTFKEGCNLETLDLNGNRLEGQMPVSLANCKKLEVLNLGNNQIHDTFPFWLENLLQLRVLVLRSNKFHGTIGHLLTNHSFPLLQIFDLSFNSFTGSLPSNMFRSWKAMMDKGKSQSQFLSKGFLTGYYQDKVTIVNKGQEMKLTKILIAFTTVDLSNNQFHGDIPKSIGDLKSLHVLNMSYNYLTGQIPASLGNIEDLESLDLSHNNLSGEIPQQLTKLTFLAVLNLSQNYLVGSIPQSQQFLTFTSESFQGNPKLCGPPLLRKCGDVKASLQPTQSESKYDWEFTWIGFEVGYGVGIGILFWTLALWTKGRRRYIIFIDKKFC